MIDFNTVIPNAEKETREFLNRFDSFSIKSTERQSVTFDNGIKISYSIDVSSSCLHQIIANPSNKYSLPIQVVARVTMNGEYMSTWGCTSQDDNNLMLIWFQLKSNEAQNIVDHERAYIKKDYEKLMGISN